MSGTNNGTRATGEPAQSPKAVDHPAPAKRPGRVSLWRRGDGVRLTAVVVLCLALGALVTWVLPYFGAPMRTGPLAWQDGGNVPLAAAPDPRSSSYGYAGRPDPVGHRFTYGTDVLTMPPGSDDTAVIRKVEPLGLGPGVRFLGSMLGSPDRRETWSEIDGWPPKDGQLHDPVPLDTPITSRTADEMGWELYLGFQITRPGSYASDGWEVTYEVNGRTYRHVVPARVVVCTPEAPTQGRFCAHPEDP